MEQFSKIEWILGSLLIAITIYNFFITRLYVKQTNELVTVYKELVEFKKSSAYILYLERKRQIEEEGYNVVKDSENYKSGELIGASAGYLETYLNNIDINKNCNTFGFAKNIVYGVYPWKIDKRNKHSQQRKLEIAGALILAEIDRNNE